jgi:hypothetical protein
MRLSVLILGLFGLVTPAALGADPGLTFFAWSDQHVTAEGDASHVLPAVEALNKLPGAPYPEKIGGTVPAPAFVFSCGDGTDAPTPAAVAALDDAIAKRLKFPSFEIVGNHDETGAPPNDAVRKWVAARHGATSYTFDRGGVHFVAPLATGNDAAGNLTETISKEALDFIRADLAKTPKGTPVVVAMHVGLGGIKNRDDVVRSFGDANVVLVLGGHFHKTAAGEFKGFRYLVLPSCKPEPEPQGEVVVVRITADRLLALTWDYRAGKWSDDPKKTIDAAIKGPTTSAKPQVPGSK